MRAIVIALAIALLGTGSAAAQITGIWRGGYECGQGRGALVLDLTQHPDGRVTGTFDFDSEGRRGVYELEGALGSDGTVTLSPGRWINRPAGFGSVGLEGRVDGEFFSGTILHQACGGFGTRRESFGADQSLADAIISMPANVSGQAPGADPAIVRNARPIPSAQASGIQPNPPNTPLMTVYVAGRSRAYQVQPFVAYELPLGPNERRYDSFRFYTPTDTPELTDHGLLPYVGRFIRATSRQEDGSTIAWTQIDVVRRPPGLEHIYPYLYGPPDLWMIDGYLFHSREDIEHYLRRQPAGRVVELMFQSNLGRRTVGFVIYVPLMNESPAFTWQAARVADTAPGYRTDVLADAVASIAAPAITSILQSATTPMSLTEMFQRAEENARRCREAGGVC